MILTILEPKRSWGLSSCNMDWPLFPDGREGPEDEAADLAHVGDLRVGKLSDF